MADLYRRAPLIVHRAIYWDEALPMMPCVFIISNSGGILQGDRNTVSIEMAPHTQAHVTSQSATKIHEMDANFASQLQEIVLHEGAYLEYLPEPTIPHRHSRFITDTRVTLDPSATLIYSEILMGGRKHHGELFQYDLFSSSLRGERPNGDELFTEKFVITPRLRDVRQVGIMGSFDVFGTAVLLTPKEHADRIVARVPAEMSLSEALAAGASRLPNDAGLIYKVLGMETQPVRAKIREFWAIVRKEVVGARLRESFRGAERCYDS